MAVSDKNRLDFLDRPESRRMEFKNLKQKNRKTKEVRQTIKDQKDEELTADTRGLTQTFYPTAIVCMTLRLIQNKIGVTIVNDKRIKKPD